MNQTILSFVLPSGQSFRLVHGDITTENTEAIVNAANQYLSHGGGLAGAIVTKGGEIIQDESDQWVATHGWVTHSHPAYTSAGHLKFKYIIHAVGPVWGEGNEEQKLHQAVFGSLELAESLNLSSLAIPPISTGIFRFPKDLAAQVILQSIADYFSENPASPLVEVHLTIIDQASLNLFLEQVQLWQKKNL